MLWLEEWLKSLKEEMDAVTDEEVSARDSEREEVSESDNVVGQMNDELVRFAVVRSRRLRQYEVKVQELISSIPDSTHESLEEIKAESLVVKDEQDTLDCLFWFEVEKQFPTTSGNGTCLRRGGTVVVREDDSSQIESRCVLISGPFPL